MRPLFSASLNLSLALCLAPAAMAGPLENNLLSAKQILFIADQGGANIAIDEKVAAHLNSLGARVTIADDSQPTFPFAGKDLIIISSTADAQLMGGQIRDLPVPVITWNSAYLPRLGMTGRVEGSDFGITEEPDTYLSMVNQPHPMSAGLTAGNFVAVSKGTSMAWGRPAAAASVIATPPGYPERAVIFGYESGALLATGVPAPARRVGFFFQDRTFDVIEAVEEGRQAKGLSLFDAALTWLVAQPTPAAPRNRETARASGKSLIFVTQLKSQHPSAEVREAVDRTNTFLMTHFRAMGFNVTLVGEDDPVANAAGKDVIVIAATVRANRVLGKYKDVPVPILCLENDILDDMAMTGKRRHVDFGESDHAKAVLVNALHPVSAGVSAGPIHLYRSEGILGFGIPGPGVTVMATLDGKRKAAIFGYERGASMDDNVVATARRIYFPIDFKGVEDMTETGLRIFDSALMWAAEGD